MADNITVKDSAGTEKIIATDELTFGGSTVHIGRQRASGGPNITVGQVEVTNTNTSIVSADDDRVSLTLVNRQTVAVWIDDATATTSGFRLDPGDSITLSTSAAINGITSASYTASGDAKIHYVAVHD